MQRHPLSLASCTASLYFLRSGSIPLFWYYDALRHSMRLLLLLLLPLLLLLLLLLLRLLLLTYLPTYLPHLPTYLPTSYTIHYNNLNFFHHQTWPPSPPLFQMDQHRPTLQEQWLFASVLETFEPSLITADGFSLTSLINCSAWEPNKASLFKTNKK